MSFRLTLSTSLYIAAGLACARSDRADDALLCHPSPGNPGVEICDTAPPHVELAHAAATTDDLNPRLLRRFKPLRTNFRQGPAALVDLGRMLYYDPRLSKTGLLSCNSCHPLDHYGMVNEQRSQGVSGKRGARNTPSTYNAAPQISQFWDGRSPNVESQALFPLLDPDEMGMTAKSTVDVLTSIRGYLDPFRAAFPGDPNPIALKNVGIALGAFEQTLSTPSRWDQYLKGDRTALSEKEKEGLRVFTSVGCMVCHTGELIGGSMYEKLGAAVPWPNATDHGRAGVTHDPADEMVFKVPSLRNVAEGGPYFHDGSVRTLDEAVRMMAIYQLGEDLSDAEVSALVAWLGSLTGQPANDVRAPVLPITAAQP
jgi:cytochrome c peroxidase